MGDGFDGPLPWMYRSDDPLLRLTKERDEAQAKVAELEAELDVVKKAPCFSCDYKQRRIAELEAEVVGWQHATCCETWQEADVYVDQLVDDIDAFNPPAKEKP